MELEWISIEKEFPPESDLMEMYLITANHEGNDFTTVCCWDSSCENWDDWDEGYGKITHWMPLPPPAIQKKGKKK